MGTIRMVRLGAIAICVVALAPVTAAQARWSAPQALPSPALGIGGKPTVTVAANGAAIIGMGDAAMNAPAQFAFRPAGASSFQAPVALHAAPLSQVGRDDSVPGVALLPDGSAIALFDEGANDGSYGIYATHIAADGTPGTATKVAAEDQVMDGFQLAVDSAGRVTATWKWSNDSGRMVLQYAQRGTDGTWTAPTTIGSDVLGWHLAQTPSGEAYIALDQSNVPTQLLRRASATGAFTHVADLLSPSGHSSAVTALSIDPAGGLATSWIEWDDHGVPSGSYYAVRTPGGTLGAATPLPAGVHVARANGTTLLLGDRNVHPDTPDPTFQASLVTEAAQPDGSTTPGTAHDITPAGFGPPDDWALAPDGTLVAPYVGEDPLTAQPLALAATRAPDGTWSAPTPVGDQADQLDPANSQPRVAVGAADGHAVVAWGVSGASHSTIHVASWTPGADAPATPPTAPAATPATADNAQTWQGGPEHTGAIAGSGVTTALSKAWTADLGYQQAYAVQAGGRVFAVSKISGAQAVTALDVTDGHVLWSKQLGTDALRLAVGGGTLIAATDAGVYALDPATGTTRWHAADAGQWEPLPPIISGGRVYVTAEGQGSTTFAYALADGTRQWMTPGPFTQSVTLAGSRLVAAPVCADNSYRVGLAAADGSSSWVTNAFCREGDDNTIATYDGRWVWLGSMTDPNENGRILDPETGRILRAYEGSPPAFGPDGIGYRTDRGALVAFDARTLAVRFTYTPSAPITTMPLVTDGLVSVQDQAGGLHVLNRWTGAVRYSATAGAAGASSDLPPALSAGDGHLIVPVGGKLVAYAAAPAPPETPGPGEGDGGSGSDPGTGTTDDGSTTIGDPAPGGSAGRTGTTTPQASTPAPAAVTPIASLFAAAKSGGAAPSSTWHLASRAATLDHAGRLVLTVRCAGPTGGAPCSGRLAVALSRHTTLRTATLRLAPGRTATVRVTLSRAQRSKLPRTLTIRLGAATEKLRVRRAA